MKVKIVTLVVLGTLAISAASAQSTPNQNTQQQAVQGGGTPNYITKFTDKHAIGNSGVAEAGGNLTTSESLTVGGVRSSVFGSPSIGVRATNTTTDGATGTDAWVSSGLIGILGETMSPASVALEGMASATIGDPVGVFGKTVSTDRGIGVRGQAVAPSGGGIGVLGEALSPAAFAGLFSQMSSTGYPIALFGSSGSSEGGEGVHGRTNGTTGLGIGVNGDTFSPNGFGGSFTNFAGGNILRGVNNNTVVFRVDGNGTVFANGGLQPGGADFAESVAVSGDSRKYTPGDLLVIDPVSNRQLALAQQPYSTLVAGIYSTKPGMLGSTHNMAGAEIPSMREIPLAIVGIVPCKVSAENGAIRSGDLLVTSSTPGHAMKGTDRQRMLGAVVGKALEPLDKDTGMIQVLVTLQ
ncbi:MAG TPA: hypothetical protein VJN89_15495 [Candidatus Acidoferrum sp.]|nr:hypothetical protein [Candidatus Acidoferrum sp.]